MKKFSIWLPIAVFLLAGCFIMGCGGKKDKNVPSDVISLKDAKAKGPVRPNAQTRAKMKAATGGKTTTTAPRPRKR